MVSQRLLRGEEIHGLSPFGLCGYIDYLKTSRDDCERDCWYDEAGCTQTDYVQISRVGSWLNARGDECETNLSGRPAAVVACHSKTLDIGRNA